MGCGGNGNELKVSEYSLRRKQAGGSRKLGVGEPGFVPLFKNEVRWFSAVARTCQVLKN